MESIAPQITLQNPNTPADPNGRETGLGHSTSIDPNKFRQVGFRLSVRASIGDNRAMRSSTY